MIRFDDSGCYHSITQQLLRLSWLSMHLLSPYINLDVRMDANPKRWRLQCMRRSSSELSATILANSPSFKLLGYSEEQSIFEQFLIIIKLSRRIAMNLRKDLSAHPYYLIISSSLKLKTYNSSLIQSSLLTGWPKCCFLILHNWDSFPRFPLPCRPRKSHPCIYFI